jgi:hypothetical protein
VVDIFVLGLRLKGVGVWGKGRFCEVFDGFIGRGGLDSLEGGADDGETVFDGSFFIFQLCVLHFELALFREVL